MNNRFWGTVSGLLTVSFIMGVYLYQTQENLLDTDTTKPAIEEIFNKQKEASNDSSGDKTGTDKQKEASKKKQKDQGAQELQNLASTQNEDFSTMERPTVEQIEEAQSNIEEAKDLFVGQIEIPAIQLKLNILEGTTYQKMLYGATTLLPDSVIGKGNYALASHNMGVEGKMFTSIHKLQKGDAIFLTNQEGQRFEYSVVSNEVMDYRNTDRLNLTRKPTVTLITCETVTDTPNRVIVQAELVK